MEEFSRTTISSMAMEGTSVSIMRRNELAKGTSAPSIIKRAVKSVLSAIRTSIQLDTLQKLLTYVLHIREITLYFNVSLSKTSKLDSTTPAPAFSSGSIVRDRSYLFDSSNPEASSR
jgi:hypothetical protein